MQDLYFNFGGKGGGGYVFPHSFIDMLVKFVVVKHKSLTAWSLFEWCHSNPTWQDNRLTT